MKKFKIRIEEILATTVLIEAENEEDAKEKLEELCDSFDIELTFEDFAERVFTIQGEATQNDIKIFQTYK